MREAQNDIMIRAWWYLSNNFGDSINELIIRSLSKKHLVASVDKSEPHFIVCGSILSESNKNSTVWGAGFSWEHHKKSDLYGCENVIAVRGDLSAERAEAKTIKAIGDPALLLPQIYRCQKHATNHIGVIPHWTNIEAAIEKYPEDYLISPLLPYHIFIKRVVSCEYIFSESLHGLIVADAYGVKNKWVDLGANVGDKFKYADYYSSTVTPEERPLDETDTQFCQIHKYKYNLQTLLNSCPFYGHDSE